MGDVLIQVYVSILGVVLNAWAAFKTGGAVCAIGRVHYSCCQVMISVLLHSLSHLSKQCVTVGLGQPYSSPPLQFNSIHDVFNTSTTKWALYFLMQFDDVQVQTFTLFRKSISCWIFIKILKYCCFYSFYESCSMH